MHINEMMNTFEPIDFIAILIFILCWIGYAFYADYSLNRKGNLIHIMYDYRLQWMQEMITRKDRIVDSRVVGNLMHSVTFFGSTSILIIAGLVTLMGYGEKATLMLSYIPFAITNPLPLWVVKTLTLVLIFTYAFFKHTWSLRLFNYVSIFVVSTPYHTKIDKKASAEAEKVAKVLSNAARHFNMGMRGYYFGMAALGWFIHPFLLIITSIWVVIVLYRREYMSKTLAILSKR